MGLIFLVSTIHEVKEMGRMWSKKTWHFFIAGGHLGPSYTEKWKFHLYYALSNSFLLYQYFDLKFPTIVLSVLH